MGPKNTFYISVLATQIHCERGLGVYVNVIAESEAPGTRAILEKIIYLGFSLCSGGRRGVSGGMTSVLSLSRSKLA